MFNFLYSDENENENENEILKQGSLMLQKRQEFININKSNLDIIEQTSDANLGSIIDGNYSMENMENMENTDEDYRNTGDNTLKSGKDNSRIALDSNYLQFIIWLLISIFLILLTLHTFTTTEQSLIVQLFLGSIIIFILYQLFLYIRNKYF